MTRAARAPMRPSASAGRVIAGTARGVRLVAPGEGTRPLGDRVKQSLFAILEPQLRGRPFVDLFAGSGAAGIEALSRGASRAVLVERDRAARRAIQANLDAAGFEPGRAVVIDDDVGAWLALEAGRARHGDADAVAPAAVVFVDPPYDLPDRIRATIAAIAEAGPGVLLDANGTLVAKHFWKADVPERVGLLVSFRRERFGETMLTFYGWEVEADR